MSFMAIALAFVLPSFTPGSDSARVEDDDETIYVVQEKVHRVAGTLEVSPALLIGVGDRFVSSYAPMLRVAYHVDERFAFESSALFMFASDNNATRELYLDGDLLPELAKMTRLRFAVGLNAAWRPIYGKVQLFGGMLGTFSLQLGAGGALLGTTTPCFTGDAIDPGGDTSLLCGETAAGALWGLEPTKLRFAGQFSAAIDFSFSETFGVRLEGRDYMFPVRVLRFEGDDEDVEDRRLVLSDAIRNNIFVGVGVNFRFFGPES